MLDNSITASILDQEQNSWNVKLKTAEALYEKCSCLIDTCIFTKVRFIKAISALQNWSPLAGRGQVLKIKLKANNASGAIHLIDESYNANPGSVRSSLETLTCIFTNKKGICKYKRRIAVLGDMLELGLSEIQEHVNISKFARLDKIDKIYCVGSRMRKLYDVLPYYKRGAWTETALEMQNVLVNKLDNGDIVMIKGSFSMGMNKIVDKLKSLTS